MNLTGSTLSSPFRVAVGGTLAVVRTAEDIAREALVSVIETRPGEREGGGYLSCRIAPCAHRRAAGSKA